MRVIKVEPGRDSYVDDIPDDLDEFRKYLGGYVDDVPLGGRVIAWVNDEGILHGLPWNRQLPGPTPLAGNILICCIDDGGNNVEVPESLVGHVQHFFDHECQRMNPTPSSIEEYERIAGRPAISFEEWP